MLDLCIYNLQHKTVQNNLKKINQYWVPFIFFLGGRGENIFKNRKKEIIEFLVGKTLHGFFYFFILGWRTLVHSCWYNNLTWYTSCKYIKRKRGLVIFVLIFFRQKTLFFREITYLILLKDCQKIHNCNLHMEMNIEDNWKSCNNR